MCQPGRPLPQGLSQKTSPGLAAFHRAKSSGFSFSSSIFDARTGLHIFQFAAREPAVILIFVHAEVDIAVFGGVGIALVDQPLHEFDDQVNRVAHARVGGGRQDVQVGQVLVVIVDVAFGQFERVFAQFVGARDDLVVHVGVVHHVFDFVAAILKVAADDIEDQRRHGVPDMRVVIDRDAADVHLDQARFEGLEFFFFAGDCVVYANHSSLVW